MRPGDTEPQRGARQVGNFSLLRNQTALNCRGPRLLLLICILVVFLQTALGDLPPRSQGAQKRTRQPGWHSSREVIAALHSQTLHIIVP